MHFPLRQTIMRKEGSVSFIKIYYRTTKAVTYLKLVTPYRTDLKAPHLVNFYFALVIPKWKEHIITHTFSWEHRSNLGVYCTHSGFMVGNNYTTISSVHVAPSKTQFQKQIALNHQIYIVKCKNCKSTEHKMIKLLRKRIGL